MTNTNRRRIVGLLLAGCLVNAGVSAQAQKQAPVVAAPPVDQTVPTILDPEVADWLKRGDYERALVRCELEIRSAPLVAEPGSLAPAHLCLGEALYARKQYGLAATAFTDAVSDLETSVGVFDPRLVVPLEGLGKALIGLGEFEAAESVLSKAKDITHRNFGIYNLVQTPIVNSLVRTYYERGELTNANREQNFLMRANEETYGEQPQLLPALRRLGKWQERIGRADLARRTYQRAMRIMERAYGTNDLRLAGPLRDFADSYLNTPRGSDRVMSGAGGKALRGIVALYENQEFTDAADLAEAWADLGDWYVIGGRRRQARDAYTAAGRVLQEAGATQGDGFSSPVEIEYEDVPIGIRPSRVAGFPEGVAVIEFEFTVTAEGRVTDLIVVRDDLNYPRFALEVGQRVKASRYRPRIVDGIPVATPGMRKALRYDLARRVKNKTVSKEADSSAPAEERDAEPASDQPAAPGGEAAPDQLDDSSGDGLNEQVRDPSQN